MFEALLRVDNNIQKLDTVDMDFIRAVDRPTSPSYDVKKVVEQLKAFRGHVIVQTIVFRAPPQPPPKMTKAEQEVFESIAPLSTWRGAGGEAAWLAALKEIAPQSVMIYTIDRETPVGGLLKTPPEELDRIRDLVISEGIPCTASY